MAIMSSLWGAWHGCRLRILDFDPAGRITNLYVYARVSGMPTDEVIWDNQLGVYVVRHVQSGEKVHAADLEAACMAAWAWEQQRLGRQAAIPGRRTPGGVNPSTPTA